LIYTLTSVSASYLLYLFCLVPWQQRSSTDVSRARRGAWRGYE
jgi:hypothetical protein